ncbi:MAG TPA: gliding motility-associated C-terminal domain-containing protein, partial [Chitinophagales bacterium]|nr:gliding motility-associated C-terminal domain-containing protein [Chitinophagales bacterium]
NGSITTTAGIYTDTLSTMLGCDSIVIATLTVNPVSATTVKDTICQGNSFTLPNGTSVTAAGSYPVTLANRFGCDSVVTTQLTVLDVTVTAQETDALCNGQSSGTITAGATGGVTPYTYDLTENGNPAGSNTTGSFNALAAGNYDVSATDNFGCGAATTVQINEPTILQLTDAPEDVTCYGLADGKILLMATGGTPAYTYTVNGQNNTSGSFAPLNTGTYNFIATDAHGCADSGTVSINQPDAINIELTPDSTIIKLGQNLALTASTNYDPYTSYLWTPAEGLSCYDCPAPIVAINSTMQYFLTVTATINGHDCTADTTLTVTVIPDYDIFIPNVFSPNNDLNNDFFQIFGNLQGIKFLQAEIFDRWGEKVFESNNIYFKWDGNFKGKPVPQQVLTYTIRVVFVNNHTEKLFTGSLTLLR